MSGLTGTGTLLRLAARRDRVLIPVSALALTALSVGSAQATVALYTDPETAMAELGPVLNAPSTMAMYGPATTTNLEGLSVFKTLLMGAVFVGLLAFAVVRRHTRVEEEDGRLELLGAGVVGRQAPLAAAVALAVLATLVTAGLSVLGFVAIGFPARGSLAFGAAWTIAGLTMTGITAVAAQLTSSARGAAGWAVGALALLYLVRAIGDSATTDGGRVLRWFSPFGWASQVFPFGKDRLWLVLPALALAAVLVGVAFALLERRDLGAGLFASRPGRARAPRGLLSPAGLAWRLSRGGFVGWLIGFGLLGLVFGGLVSQVDSMLGDENIQTMLAQMAGVPVDELLSSMAAVYAATMVRFMTVAAAAAGVIVVLRLASEERSGRTEAVLATAAGRTRWYAAFTSLALVVAAVLILALSALMGVRGHAALAAAPTAGDLLQGAAEAIPAAWVCVGVAALLTGLSSRLAPWSWAVLGVAFVLGEFGPTMNLPSWLVDSSPFAHVRAYPFGTWDTANVVVLTTIAFVLVVAGALAHRRRDLG
ncbi:MAG: polyketide antibiotic transporter [Actinobacteria bacterium]|nr:polyketide antibiotic transporter [Actinomycetota bacterium]